MDCDSFIYARPETDEEKIERLEQELARAKRKLAGEAIFKATVYIKRTYTVKGRDAADIMEKIRRDANDLPYEDESIRIDWIEEQ